MSFNLIDTHAHIYFDDFKKDIDSVIAYSLKNNINKILMPNVNVESLKEMIKLSHLYSEICYPMIGLHPCYVKENYKKELNIMENYIQMDSIVGIGEIGIDLYRDKTYYKEQVDAFEIQCYWAMDKKLPVVIHTRNSLEQTIKIIKKSPFRKLRGVFHCFEGNYYDAMQLIDLGFLLGIGGKCTFKSSNLSKVLSQIGLENLVLETDSPFLSPVPKRGERNQPGNIIHIAKKLEEITTLPMSKIAQITSSIAENLFNL